jgi:hypothetical protein
VAIITVFGPGISTHGDVPLGEEFNGMNMLSPGIDWEKGGPLILHSEWWLRAHWGRAFEIVALRPGDPGGPPPLFGQSILVLRKRPGSFTAQELERFEHDEPRELAALMANLASLRREVEDKTEAIRVFETSRSWRLTAPLRAIAKLLRGRDASQTPIQRRAGAIAAAREALRMRVAAGTQPSRARHISSCVCPSMLVRPLRDT